MQSYCIAVGSQQGRKVFTLQTLPDEIFRTTLQPGQGLISNNVLHDRSGFDDDGEHKRQLYRLRYYQRMN